jgi:acetamidase/formamidase
MLTRQQVDDEFIKGQTRDEANQDFEQALHDHTGPEYVEQQSGEDVLRTVVQQYGQRQPSTASPMYRLCFIGRTNDPLPLAAQQANETAGVSSGSLKATELRSNAAGLAADELEVDSNPDAECSSISNVQHPTTRHGSQGDLLRVRKKVQKRKRTSSMVVHADKRARSD